MSLYSEQQSSTPNLTAAALSEGTYGGWLQRPAAATAATRMQIRFSPSVRIITISSTNGCLDLLKLKVAERRISYRTLFHAVLVLAFLLPFVFILTAVVTLEGVNNCSSFDCLGRQLGPRFLGRSNNGDSVNSQKIVQHLNKILEQVKSEEIPVGYKLSESFSEFLSDMKNNQYDAKTFAVRLKATMERMDRELKRSRVAEQLHKHFAATTIPKGMHCLSLRLIEEYASNAQARKQLPPPELLSLLSDNSYHHFVLATDNILAASVVVTSVLRSSLRPERAVFHVITDKNTYPGMHSWFALNPLSPVLIEVKGVHQFDWLARDNVPLLEAIANHYGVTKQDHGNPMLGVDIGDNSRIFASNLQARSPKYVSLLNHLRIHLPELFPNLNKVVLFDDDVVVQRDLSPLWEIDLSGKVNGAVETCEGGDDTWVMGKHFRTYFNFSEPLMAGKLDPDECAWAYGMNVLDLNAWRKTNISETYHYWVKENLKSNLTLWRVGTLPAALIAFRGHVHPIDPSWHMLGLGSQEMTDFDSVKKAAVIHYNGQCKPWLEIAYKPLQPFWTKHVNFSNDFIRNCHILKPEL